MSATYYSYRDIQDLLGVSRATVHRLVAAGRLPKPLKLGPGKSSSVRFEAAKVHAALAAMQV